MKTSAATIIFIFFSIAAYAFGGKDSSAFYFQKAKALQEQRRWNDAENHYIKALGYNSENFEIQQAYGNYFLELRKYKEAKTIFEKMHQMRPSDTATLSQLATLSYNLKKYPEAATHLSEMSKYAPSEFTYLRLGKAYVETEDYGKAINAFQEVIKMNPANGEGNYELARCYAQSNNFKKAMPYYQQAVTNRPDKYMWIYELGMLYFGLGDYENAVTTFENAAAAGMAKDLVYLENLGMAQINTKAFQAGIATLEQLMVKKPNDPTITYLLAQAWFKNGKFEKARDMWEKTLSIDETNYRALYMIGVAWQRSGKVSKGQEICDRAISLDSSLAKMKIEKFSF